MVSRMSSKEPEALGRLHIALSVQKRRRFYCFSVDYLYYCDSFYTVSSLLHPAFSVEKFMQNSLIIINVKNVWRNSLLKYSLEIVRNADFK